MIISTQNSLGCVLDKMSILTNHHTSQPMLELSAKRY